MSYGRHHVPALGDRGLPKESQSSPALLAPSLALDYLGSALSDSLECLSTGDIRAAIEAITDAQHMAAQIGLEFLPRVAKRQAPLIEDRGSLPPSAVPRADGSWGIYIDGQTVGSYATCEDALRVARRQP